MTDIPGNNYLVRIAVLEEQVKAQRREIEQQAREYERRLTDLNHAHEKQVRDQQTYVSDDKFIGWQGEINNWRSNVSGVLSELQGRTLGVGTTRAIVMQIIPMLIALAAIVALILKK